MTPSEPLDLRPLTLAELSDRTFRLYRQNFITFLGIVILTQSPLYAIQILITVSFGADPDIDPANLATLLQGPTVAVGIITFLLTVLFTQIGAAALTKAISDSYLGRSTSIRESFQRLGGTWFTLIFALILAGLVIFTVAIPAILVFFIPCIGQIVGFIGILAVALIGNVIVSLVPPVVVLEKNGPSDAVRRAWELGKKRFRWIVGYLFLLSLLSAFIIQGPALLLLFLFETVLGNMGFFLRNILEQSTTLILATIFLPIELTAITLMYFDLRIRYEGFDLMVLAEQDQDSGLDASDLTTKKTL